MNLNSIADNQPMMERIPPKKTIALMNYVITRASDLLNK